MAIKLKPAEIEAAKANLRALFPKGSTVYTILRHVSKSGMSRDISVMAMAVRDGEPFPLHPNHTVGQLLGYRVVSRVGSDAIRVMGGGMDMGYHIVHTLASVLYGDGYALKHRWI